MNKQVMEEEIIYVLKSMTKLSDSNVTFINDRIKEKTEQQLKYVLSPIDENVFLEACAGSGKTEVVGIKTAYEINKWDKRVGGLAVLTFTNEATKTIKNRVEQFARLQSVYPHYIGTLSGFIHGFIAQKFGYKYFAHKNQNNDTSYALIDKHLDIYKNHWIENYVLPIQYITSNNQKINIYANQIYYDYKVNDYIIHIPEDIEISLTNYYNSEKFQEYVKDLRKKTKKEWLFKLDYIEDEVNKVKIKFLKSGFANFEDINNIAYKILKNDSRVASLIAAKFPVIFIDECQDLSWIEIKILEKLSDSGSILHFIGDLNQSIYEFKNANPKYTENFVSNFKRYELTDNFRSCHSIVQTVNRILSINLPIKGLAEDKLKEESICYLEYDDISLLREKYSSFLKQVNIPIKNTSILVRQQSLKNKLDKNDIKSRHLLIDALQLWTTKIPMYQLMALELAGKQLQKWFGGSKTKKNYYCPISISSVYRWRIFLKDYLEALSEYPVLLDFSNNTYSQWYKIFNKHSSKLIQAPYKGLQRYDSEDRDFSNFPTYRTPSGTAQETINIYIDSDNIDYPPINTIHSVKGKDYDGVLVVSSQRNMGSGHWKQWIDSEGEAKRIGYVASTRARYSLVWAIPKLKKEDRIKIESYGFKSIEIGNY